MKILAINGSPRKNGNTATLLNKALEGATSKGAETELINLYDLHYRGCISCFSCKRINGKSYGKCTVNDDLIPVLKKVETADAIILGSPLYFGRETGLMSSCLERLLFQYLVYDSEYSSLFGKKISTGYIYTMNVNEEQAKISGYYTHINANKLFLAKMLGSSETLLAYDTYQFNDYSKYVCTAFSEQHKAEVKATQFPLDCKKAFDMGVRFAKVK
ncbi:MAG: flavodoxin [Firmicutes bacterium]|nr:flavodoxin [Bacillota bacterium]